MRTQLLLNREDESGTVVTEMCEQFVQLQAINNNKRVAFSLLTILSRRGFPFAGETRCETVQKKWLYRGRMSSYIYTTLQKFRRYTNFTKKHELY